MSIAKMAVYHVKEKLFSFDSFPLLFYEHLFIVINLLKYCVKKKKKKYIINADGKAKGSGIPT